MQNAYFRQRLHGRPGSSDAADLRRNVIVELIAAMIGFGWIVTASALNYDGRPEQLIIAFLLIGGAAASYLLRNEHFQLALASLTGALIAAIACQQWVFPGSQAQFLYPVAVVIASLISSTLGVFVVASAASAVCLAIAHAQAASGPPQGDLAMPIFLIYLTAFAAWLSARQVHIALNWMQSSYARTHDLLEQLRDERAVQASTIKALEEAHVRIEKMNHALSEARSVAEEARRLKAEFAANVSHELRTPLNIIIGFSETMANAPETYAGATWTPALRGDVEQIYQSSRHLSGLIDDILDLSALDVNQLGLTMEDTDIGQVIDEATGVVDGLFHAKRLYLKRDVPLHLPLLSADVIRVRQVLINLLSNASRFTSQGGVTVSARKVENEVWISVADTGIGIAAQDVPKVFENFGQVDGSTTRRHEGTGLGVPLSKRLVELHNGRMWLESKPGQGTTFYFSLPMQLASRPVTGWQSRGADIMPSAYRKSLLFAGPDPLLLRIIRRQLSSYDIVEVGNDSDLPSLIQQRQPIALVVDRQGVQTHANTRTDEVPADLPVIVVSLPGGFNSAQALGIEGYLIKPVTRALLRKTIQALPHAIRNVLIVDDDPQLVELFSRMLQSAGSLYRPIKAFGGAEALARLHRESVDLVLLDMLMPEVDGLAVLRAMKAERALAEIPVVMISAQYPQNTQADEGLCVQMLRAQGATIMETLSYLSALVGTLPPRGLPAAETVPAS